ncbi:MAG TPA: ABC transporter permease [Beijerinckiaceae bacterium]|nr:ABC transporter permease [Beijerinckiaceae bacterium]
MNQASATTIARSASLEQESLALKQNLPLVPGDSIAGRALVTVVAIMTFLAALAAGAALLVNDAAHGWSDAVARDMTIQVRPTPGRDVDDDVTKAAALARAAPGIADVQIFSKDESERLLEPWLGKGLALDELPIPRLIVVTLAVGRRPDLAALEKNLTETVPSASLDDHRLWLDRLSSMARALVLIATLIFVLVLTAMAMAVAFATSGAMADNREVVAVLHFVGAHDRFIAREFQRHFLKLGLKGGAIGGAAACLFFLAASYASHWWVASPGGDQVEALFGTFALGPIGFAAIAAVSGGIGFLTGRVSRSIVFRHLGNLS